MIQRTAASWQPLNDKDQTIADHPKQVITSDRQNWQAHLQQLITEPSELFTRLQLDIKYLPAAIKASELFPLRVPISLLNRIEKGNINDPILQQVLPIKQEFAKVSGFTTDPVGEQQRAHSGLIQKYYGRVLLLVNGHCAVHCRYCFRRHFPYADNRLNRSQWQEVIEQIANDNSISEVIYSGGDPLASNDKQLQWLTEQIAKIPHVTRLRVHTRLPVVIPSRITDDTLAWMSQPNLSTIVVLHINHANELNDNTLLHSLTRMKQAGVTLLNQAVLLKGINDCADTLVKLSHSLFSAGILPYYLHVLDKVDGAAHFEHSDEYAKALHEQIIAHLPGYLVPKLVREIDGEPAKTGL